MAGELDEEEGVKSERVTNFLTVPGEVEKVSSSRAYQGTFLTLTSTDHSVRGRHLPRLVSVHLHHPAPPRARRVFPPHLQHPPQLFLSIPAKAPPTVAQVRPRQGAHPRRDALHPAPHYGREQDVPQRPWAGDCQALRTLQCLGGTWLPIERIAALRAHLTSQIADRLCCSFGQDLQDSLFSRQTFGRRHDGSRPHIRPVALIALNTAYVGASTRAGLRGPPSSR